ncbi:MAG: acetyl-CoA hydrolase/transferase C-terminal domain-containing protein [Pseudomonadota bacterium]
MAKSVALQEIVALIEPGMRVLLHGGPVECAPFRDALRADPERARHVTFTGLFLPGVNLFDYAGLTPSTRVEAPFLPPSSHGSFMDGRLEFLPFHYSDFITHLSRQPADLAILHLPPAERGSFSCGLGADVADGVLRFARRVAVVANPAIPFTGGASALKVDEADWVCEQDTPLAAPAEPAQDPALSEAAQRVADLIEDGDTLQIGIGRLPSAVLAGLTDRRRLRFHTGMIIDEVRQLLDAGACAPACAEDPPVLTGIGLGGADMRAAAARPEVAFHGIGVTHDVCRIARITRFTSINSAIEVDLLGNINCEHVRGRQVSGIGGASDFTRAARLAPNGRAIVALPAQAHGKSRIVPRLEAGTTSITRNDTDILVTEHGSARVRGLGLDARAEAIMALAAPHHRPALADAWRALRSTL